jgi:O-antigen/teichoic acid export membrane protein
MLSSRPRDKGVVNIGAGARARNRRGSVMTLAGASLLPALLAIVSGPLLARALAPNGRGQLAAVLVYTFALPIVLSLGVPDAIGQRAATEPAMRPQLLATAIRFACFTGPIAILADVAILALPLRSIHGGARLLAALSLGVAPLGVLGISLLNLLLAEGALGAVATLRALTQAANGAVTVGLFLAGRLTVTTYLTLNLALSVANLSGLWFLVREHPRGSYPLRPLLGFGLRGFIGSLANMANARLDQMLIVPFVGSAQLGLYAVSVSISSVPLGIAQSIGARSYGEVALSKDRPGAAARYVRLTAVAGVVMCAGAALLAPLVLPALYGARFGGSVIPLLTLLPGTLALAVLGTSSPVLSILNRPGILSIAELVGLCVTITGLWLLLSRFGIVAAAIISSVSYGTTLAIHLVSLRQLGIRPLTPSTDDIRWIRTRLVSVRDRRAPTVPRHRR